MRAMQRAIKLDEMAECYATCHMFNIRFIVVCEPDGDRLRHWIHQIWTEGPHGSVIRQETVEGRNVATWRAAIGRLICKPPESFW